VQPIGGSSTELKAAGKPGILLAVQGGAFRYLREQSAAVMWGAATLAALCVVIAVWETP
jgi:hypothetical protein